MNLLKERIVKGGVVKPGNVLEVAGFLNHQMDIMLPSSGFVFCSIHLWVGSSVWLLLRWLES